MFIQTFEGVVQAGDVARRNSIHNKCDSNMRDMYSYSFDTPALHLCKWTDNSKT